MGLLSKVSVCLVLVWAQHSHGAWIGYKPQHLLEKQELPLHYVKNDTVAKELSNPVPFTENVAEDKRPSVHASKFPNNENIFNTIEKHDLHSVKVSLERLFPVHYQVYKHVPYTGEKKVLGEVQVEPTHENTESEGHLVTGSTGQVSGNKFEEEETKEGYGNIHVKRDKRSRAALRGSPRDRELGPRPHGDVCLPLGTCEPSSVRINGDLRVFGPFWMPV